MMTIFGGKKSILKKKKEQKNSIEKYIKLLERNDDARSPWQQPTHTNRLAAKFGISNLQRHYKTK